MGCPENACIWRVIFIVEGENSQACIAALCKFSDKDGSKIPILILQLW